uniref:kinesin-like protein KIN-6 n=1 Tax=Erigeron canadensis TaxID=72917 RepID=UPI001CB9D40A|nr:kinesin-like protein KIN-6 [Erigeron canadensis]
MEELKSPPPSCPKTVTVRRNPPRRARPTPYSAAPSSSSKPPPPSSSIIRSFPIDDILSINIPEPPPCSENQPKSSEKLKVFLRIRPPIVVPIPPKPQPKTAWPQNPNKKNEGSRKATETCLKVIDSCSVTLCPPQSVVDVRRTKSEVYQGFSYVFSPQSTQNEVYEKMVNPLVDDFLKGKSGMLAAMGPSGSGKTHTVFGTNRDPGMVSLALRQIFSKNKGKGPKISRTFFLSMFEIYSERGKGEKMMDLSHEGGDVYMQQSTIKGLQEVAIHDAQQAESLIASGMLRRSTAMTNSNIQSSRSQCIINIRSGLDNLGEDATAHLCTATLTIVDLAGAEREKRTGNQGARLLESNFINNTAMVFGLCLRSLLEHQKNPKKPFHKHFQNSLLTKYLRDFLEGKKRMALILTAKPGEDDYQDTSYLLRQAAPFMNIKFENVEEQPAITLGNKRRTQGLLKAEHVKRKKLNCIEVSPGDEVKCGDQCEPHKEDPVSIELESEKDYLAKENVTSSRKRAKESQILLNISIAMWNVLKEYKKKLQASENEADTLRRSLTIKAERCTALETELILAKASCSCGKEVGAEYLVPKENEVEALSTSCLTELQRHWPVDIHVGTSSAELASTSPIAQIVEEQRSEKNYVPGEYVLFGKHDLTELGDTDFISEVAGCDTCKSAVCDAFVDGDEISSHVKGDQRKHEQREPNAQLSPSDPSESETFQKQEGLGDTVNIDQELSSVEAVSISSDFEKFEVQSNEKVDASSPSIVAGKQEYKEAEKIEITGQLTGCDNIESAVYDSELLVNEVNLPSVVKVYGWKAAEADSTAHVLSSNPSEVECSEKHDILDDTGVSSVEGVSISSDPEKFDVQSFEMVDVSWPSSVCDTHELRGVKEREANGEIIDPAGQDSELPCIVGDEMSLSLVEDQLEREEKEIVDVSCPSCDTKELRGVEEKVANGEITGWDTLDPAAQDSELPCIVRDEMFLCLAENQLEPEEKEVVSSDEVVSTSSDPEKFDVQSNEIVDVIFPSSVCDKQELRGVEEREANGDITDFVGQDSELPCIVGDEMPLCLVEEQPEQEDKEVVSSVEVTPISGDPENCDVQSREIVDVSCPSSVCDIQELRAVEDREANGEITGCDALDPAGQDSELPCIAGDEMSLPLVEDQPEQEEKEVNILRSSSNLDEPKCEQKIQLLDSTDLPDQQLVLRNDVISSQKSNTSKFSEAPSVQPCQPSIVKPKRRLRPASSVMLRNINVSDFDEVTEMPKQHGKRGQKENVGDKRTQGSISLLRLLKPNLHR